MGRRGGGPQKPRRRKKRQPPPKKGPPPPLFFSPPACSRTVSRDSRRRHHRVGFLGGDLLFAFIHCLELFSQRIAQRLELGQPCAGTTPGDLGKRHRFEQGFAFGSNAGSSLEGREPAALEHIGCRVTIDVAVHPVPTSLLSILA